MTFKKIEISDLHPANPLVAVIDNINENFDTLHNSLENLEGGGVIGPTGPKGDTGQDGREGPTGATGPQGERGLQGEAGPAGKDGVNGVDGLPGVAGKDGAQGPAGAQGATGPKGDTGAQGIQGLKGETGATGATGPQGVAGPTGAQGVSITNVAITAGKLIITKSDGTTVDAGAVATTTTAPATTAPATSGPVAVGGAVNPMYSPIATTTTTKGYIAAYCNAGVMLTLDNLKFGVTTTGQRGICCATVAGTNTLSINAYYSLAGGANGTSTYWPGAVTTTTPSGSWFGWSFANAGDGATYLVNDNTNQKVYRVTMQIGPGYAGNFISIERLL